MNNRIEPELNFENVDEKECKSYKFSKRLVLIPLVIFIVAIVCFVLAMFLEVPTHRGTIYVICLAISLLCLFLSPLPCFVLSIIGTVQAVKATKKGIKKSRKYIVLGVVEIIVNIAVCFLIAGIFMGSMSV